MSSGRFLFVSHDAGGTVPPMIALAQALVRRGHDVSVLGQPSIRARATDVGCEFVPFEGIGDYEHGKAIEDQPQLALNVIAGALPGDALLAAVDRQKSDVVIVDCIIAGAAAAAESLQIPSVILFHRLYRTFTDRWFGDLWPIFEGMINGVRAGLGLETASSWADVFAPHVEYAVVPEVFDVKGTAPETMGYFGFLVPGVRSEGDGEDVVLPVGDAPAVLVSLSSTYQHQEGLLQTLVDALAALDVRALVTTGSHVDPASVGAPKHVAVREFVPHQQVLSDIDLVVTHGGMATVSSALSFGVPLVVTPIGRDQVVNAERVTALEAGVGLGTEATVDDIRAATDRVLSNPQYRGAATNVARASEAAGEAEAAATDLEGLL